MKKTLLLAALTLTLGASAFAQSPVNDLKVSGTMDVESQYVFRGKKITDAAFQPKIGFEYPAYSGLLYADLWTNQPLFRRGTAPGPTQSDEIDLYAGYSFPLGMFVNGLDVDAGNTFYWYPDAAGNTNRLSRSDESYLGFQYDTGINLYLSIYGFHDWILDQNVAEASIKYELDLSNFITKGLSLEPRLYAGWLEAHRLLGDELNAGVGNWRDSYIYYGATLTLNYQINDYTSAFVGARYSGNNDGTRFYPAFGTTPQMGGTANSIWGGAGVNFAWSK